MKFCWKLADSCFLSSLLVPNYLFSNIKSVYLHTRWARFDTWFRFRHKYKQVIWSFLDHSMILLVLFLKASNYDILKLTYGMTSWCDGICFRLLTSPTLVSKLSWKTQHRPFPNQCQDWQIQQMYENVRQNIAPVLLFVRTAAECRLGFNEERFD